MWGHHIVTGDRLIARDTDGDWGDATVVACRAGADAAEASLQVHFDGFSSKHNEWIRIATGRLKPSRESRSQYGQSAIGRRVQVQWDEDVWYSGTVARFNPNTQRHRIVFDDGDKEWYHLDCETSSGLMKWLQGAPNRNLAAPKTATNPRADVAAMPTSAEPPAATPLAKPTAKASAPTPAAVTSPSAAKPVSKLQTADVACNPSRATHLTADKPASVAPTMQGKRVIAISDCESTSWSEDDEQPLSYRLSKQDSATSTAQAGGDPSVAGELAPACLQAREEHRTSLAPSAAMAAMAMSTAMAPSAAMATLAAEAASVSVATRAGAAPEAAQAVPPIVSSDIEVETEVPSKFASHFAAEECKRLRNESGSSSVELVPNSSDVCTMLVIARGSSSACGWCERLVLEKVAQLLRAENMARRSEMQKALQERQDDLARNLARQEETLAVQALSRWRQHDARSVDERLCSAATRMEDSSSEGTADDLPLSERRRRPRPPDATAAVCTAALADSNRVQASSAHDPPVEEVLLADSELAMAMAHPSSGEARTAQAEEPASEVVEVGGKDRTAASGRPKVEGKGKKKAALPEGWTEVQRTTATGRIYPILTGPGGQKARSVREAWRITENDGITGEGDGLGGSNGSAAAKQPPVAAAPQQVANDLSDVGTLEPDQRRRRVRSGTTSKASSAAASMESSVSDDEVDELPLSERRRRLLLSGGDWHLPATIARAPDGDMAVAGTGGVMAAQCPTAAQGPTAAQDPKAAQEQDSLGAEAQVGDSLNAQDKHGYVDPTAAQEQDSFGAEAQVGDSLNAQDKHGYVCVAKVLAVCEATVGRARALRVHFVGFKSTQDEWIEVGKGLLSPLAEPRMTDDVRRERRAERRKRRIADMIAEATQSLPLESTSHAPAAAPIPLAVTTAAAVRNAVLGLRQRRGQAHAQPGPSRYSVEVVGRRVQIDCRVAGASCTVWYLGTVVAHRDLDGRHFILFDDGDDGWLQLDVEEDAERMRWVEPKTRAARAAMDEEHTSTTAVGPVGKGATQQLPPTLCDWHWKADGRLTGRVYGKAGLKDGTLITTSAVPRSQRTHTHVVTESGTAYLLGQSAQEPPEEPVRGVVAQMKYSREPLVRGFSKAPDGFGEGSDVMCSICQDTCEPGQRWDVTPCAHAFHEECLRQWLSHCSMEAAENDKPTPPPACPDCRHPLSSSRFRLFG